MRKRPVERSPIGMGQIEDGTGEAWPQRVVRMIGKALASPVQPGFLAYGMKGGEHPLPHREDGGRPATGHPPAIATSPGHPEAGGLRPWEATSAASLASVAA